MKDFSLSLLLLLFFDFDLSLRLGLGILMLLSKKLSFIFRSLQNDLAFIFLWEGDFDFLIMSSALSEQFLFRL